MGNRLSRDRSSAGLGAAPIRRPAGRRTTDALRNSISWAQRNGLFFALLALVAIFAIGSPNFLTPGNLTVILLNVSIVGLIAVPGAMLILSGYVDLSIGSMAVFAAVMMGRLFELGVPWPIAFAVGLASGPVWGLVAGYLISYLGFSAIVVTLGGLAGLRGLELVISDAFVVHAFGEQVEFLGSGRILGLPLPVWIFGMAFSIGAYAWYVTPLGRHMTAIGADRTTAHSIGVQTRRIPLALYVASAFASALGGLLLLAQLDASSQSIGVGMELSVLTAILLGGVSFVGGRGSLFGVLWGILFIGVLQNGLLVVNVSPYLSQVAVGVALVFAAALDVLYQKLERVVIPEPAEDDASATATSAEVTA
jgi:ribose transport system permease protein